MKKSFIVGMAAAAVLVSAMAASISADVLAEPLNDFYWSNPGECKYIYWRDYTVNRRSIVYTKPKASGNPSEQLGSLNEGDVTRVGFSYTDKDGTVWACCTMPDGQDGWIYMDRLDVIYDVYSFISDHEDEIRDYNGEIDWYQPEEKVVVWDYPFAENYRTMKAKYWYTAADYPYNNPLADKCWTDENGNVWVFSYRFAARDWVANIDNGWVFLPSPDTTDTADLYKAYGEIVYAAPENYSANIGITAVEAPLDDKTLEAYEAAVRSIEQAERGDDYAVPVILALSAAAASAAMIAVIGRKKEK